MRITTWGQGGYRASPAARMQSCGHERLEVGCNIALRGNHWRLHLKKQLFPFQIPRLLLFYPNKWKCVYWLGSFNLARLHVRVLGAKSCCFIYPICILRSETHPPLPFAALCDGLTPCYWRSHPVPVEGAEKLEIPPALLLLYILMDLVHELYLVAVGLAVAEHWAT